MQETTVIVKWRSGLHTRPAADLAKITNNFKSEITIIKDGDEINAKSILGIITLGAPYKDVLIVKVEGEDEKQAVEAIVEYFEKSE